MAPVEPQREATGSTYTGEALALIQQVEAFARQLISFNFSTASDIWEFQINLLSLQRETQKSISNEKTRRKIEKTKDDSLQALQMVRQHARRLGDALAWTILGNDRGIIYPLGENDPVSIPHDNHGSRGLVAICEVLASRGWGFPILHDVTDCLRIGDATFVTIDGKERKTRTIESKTRHIEPPRENPTASTQYEVTISFVGHEAPEKDFKFDIELDPEPDPPRRPDRRIDRQAKRMHSALMKQSAQIDTPFIVDGSKAVLSRGESNARSRWGEVREAIAEARSTGYSSIKIDDAFMCIFLYNSAGLSAEAITGEERIVSDIVQSGILSKGDPQYGIVTSFLPEEPKRSACNYLPFYLYSIPPEAICDILHGRLVIFSAAGVGAIASAIEDVGFRVEIPKSDHPLHSMRIFSEISGPSGKRFTAEFGHLGIHFMECAHEFMGVEYVQDVILTMKTSTEKTLPGIIGD
ncbi:hypothetical protein HUT16_20455 [Kitasatospora sp. NA04385]|uniref:hypothetical protein n=1 Tax=Kitasatospora sp. NA04385 TaxID=2742135 RepID=UPI001590D18D|nr:hypothetical protein [Kitasatospora sp. NA04385]QKW21114.1 hypothetical protein HUT16_20455 [Kitasatospora sp. NA04385]